MNYFIYFTKFPNLQRPRSHILSPSLHLENLEETALKRFGNDDGLPQLFASYAARKLRSRRRTLFWAYFIFISITAVQTSMNVTMKSMTAFLVWLPVKTHWVRLIALVTMDT